MKVKYENFKKSFGCIIVVLAVVFGFSSCKDDFTTDNSGFALYYTSMTDIGPSMSGVIASPTYKGAAPYDFEITEITHSYKNESNEDVSEPYTGDCFTINAEDGSISINSTKDMKVGKYMISVSCYSAGSLYTFKNAVEVNFLKSVPEGIIVDPNFLEAKLTDVTKKNSEAKLPTAQVTTENTAEHISITGYKISNVVRIESDDSETFINNNKIELFSISDKGVISINKSDEYDPEEVKAGLYRIDLKLITLASPNLGEEEGLFVDAIRVNLSAAPTSIIYEEGCIETGVEGDETKPRGSFTSSKPLIEGSNKDALYEIMGIKKSVDGSEPFVDASEEENNLFSIESSTGIISVPNTHNFSKGNVFKVSVKVSNPDGEYSGTDVLTLNVVEWVDEMADFTYEIGNMKQGMNFTSSKAAYDSEYYVEYSLKSVPAGYEDFFSIDKKTGEVKIEKYNTLGITEEGKPIEVEVLAKNFKDEAIGKLEVNVVENPNYFTYISYGNNLVEEQTTGSIYDNQYRFKSLEEVNSINLVPKTDIKEGTSVKWELAGKHHSANIKVNQSTGVITATITKDNWKKYSLAVIYVTATVGEGNDAFSRTFPLFFNYSKPVGGVTIDYSPFVLRVNPKNGGTLNPPTIIGDGLNMSKVYIDYYNTCSYFNLNGIRTDGTPLEDGRVDKSPSDGGSLFLRNLWDEYGEGNYGANYPISYYDGAKPKVSLQNNLAYINNAEGSNKFSVNVNPNKWYDDGWADGVFVAKLKFCTNGELPIPKGKENFCIAIWFDKNYVHK